MSQRSDVTQLLVVSEKHDEMTHKAKQMQFLAEALDDESSSSENQNQHPCEVPMSPGLITDVDALTEMTDNQCACTKKEKKFKKMPL